jgi:hypothetical protein
MLRIPWSLSMFTILPNAGEYMQPHTFVGHSSSTIAGERYQRFLIAACMNKIMNTTTTANMSDLDVMLTYICVRKKIQSVCIRN